MKNLILTAAVFLSTLLIGCQENSITEPNQPLSSKTNIEEGLLKHNEENQINTIILNNVLIDPYPIKNAFYKLNGQIDYQSTVVPYSSQLKTPSYIVYLNLSVNAVFTQFCTVCEPPFDDPHGGTISIETNDIVYLTEKSNRLEKSFLIQGREDKMYLVCRFLVTKAGIEIEKMVLYIDKDDTAALQTSL